MRNKSKNETSCDIQFINLHGLSKNESVCGITKTEENREEARACTRDRTAHVGPVRGAAKSYYEHLIEPDCKEWRSASTKALITSLSFHGRGTRGHDIRLVKAVLKTILPDQKFHVPTSGRVAHSQWDTRLPHDRCNWERANFESSREND